MQANGSYFHVYSLSEGAVTIEFGKTINEDTLQIISNYNAALNAKPFVGFYTSVPAYTTLSVFFDPWQVLMANNLVGDGGFEKVVGYLTQIQNRVADYTAPDAETITIPVCYGDDLGPDLGDVAKQHNLTEQQVIDIHGSAVYKVYMIGFVPGFAYMGGMSELIATPRKQDPRKSVPAGSVGIAGQQTGVYPLTTPGGWQIIGQTPLKMFDAKRQHPALLKAGDNVVFKPVGREEFNDLKS